MERVYAKYDPKIGRPCYRICKRNLKYIIPEESIYSPP